MTAVAFTVDLEQDCPPYLSSYRGAEDGMPQLLALLRALAIPATVFTTGDVKRTAEHSRWMAWASSTVRVLIVPAPDLNPPWLKDPGHTYSILLPALAICWEIVACAP